MVDCGPDTDRVTVLSGPLLYHLAASVDSSPVYPCPPAAAAVKPAAGKRGGDTDGLHVERSCPTFQTYKWVKGCYEARRS